MTIKQAYQMISDNTVEARWCGLNQHSAWSFYHENTHYMLSEIKGRYIRLTILKAPSEVIEEIKL